MPSRAITPAEYHQSSRVITYGLGLIAISTGLTLILQEHSRMSSPGWQTAFSYGPGPDVWGTYLLVAGAVMVSAIPFQQRTVAGWACIAIALAWSGRVIAAVVALDQPNASGTAPQAMLIVAGAYFVHGALFLGWLSRLSGRWDHLRRRM